MSVSLEEIPVLDHEQLSMMRSLDENRGVFLSELIDIFEEQVPGLIDRLDTALRSDSEAISKKLAHKIKGMGSNLGTTRLILILTDIELHYESLTSSYRNELSQVIYSEFRLASKQLRHNWHVHAA